MSMDPTISTMGFESTTLNPIYHFSNSGLDLEYLIIQLLVIIIALAGLAGNVLVLWVLCFQMQRNAFSIYILNLAGADFLCLFCRFIFSLKQVVYISSSIYFYIPGIFRILLTSTYIASVSILSAISTERCLSVLYPIWFRCRQQNHMPALICALLWAISFLLTILSQKYCQFPTWCKQFEYVIGAWLIFSFLLVFISYLILSVRLSFVFKRKQLIRLYVAIGLTVLIFLLCVLPVVIYWFLPWTKRGFYKFIQSSVLLTCVNSCANPIIYFYVGIFQQQKQHRGQNHKLFARRDFQDVPL